MTKIKEGKIADLIQDDRNLNKGTEEGRKLIEKWHCTKSRHRVTRAA